MAGVQSKVYPVAANFFSQCRWIKIDFCGCWVPRLLHELCFDKIPSGFPYFGPLPCINYSLWQWRRQLISGAISGCVIAFVSHSDWFLSPFFLFSERDGSAVCAGPAAADGAGALGKIQLDPIIAR